MSLKAFHVLFVTASSALAFGCGLWGLRDFFSPDGRAWDLVFGLGSFAVSIGLILYERYFLKKLKRVSYL
ncbi:MAG: hypothetical protein ACLQU3_00870 [Limisphaerales bacterium]|jgi:hypothetical protein